MNYTQVKNLVISFHNGTVLPSTVKNARKYGEDFCGFLAWLGEGENFLALGRDTNIRNLEGKIQVNLVDV